MIRDGTGGGNLVRVSSDNRMNTSSRMNERIYYVSRNNEKSFVVHMAGIQAVGGTTQGLGYIQYTGSDKLFIDRITVVTEEPTTGLTKFGIWVDSTTTSGGDAILPVNLNRASAITSESTCIHDNDGTPVTISGGSSISTVRLGGPDSFIVEFKNALILSKNNIFSVKCNAATTGTKIRCFVLFYEESV